MGKSKYGAVRTEVDGITFASKKEAKRYGELKLLEKAGEIKELQLQPEFVLHAPSRYISTQKVKVGVYRADFRYRQGPRGILVIEDVKGKRTAMYSWKKRHVEAEYNVQIIEV